MNKYLNYIRLSVKDLLQTKGLTQAELASAMGVTRQNLNKLMTVDRMPTLTTIESIAAGFKVEPFYLLMSPAERVQWHQRTAESNPRAQLQKLVDEFPADRLGTAVASLTALSNAVRAQEPPAKVKLKSQG